MNKQQLKIYGVSLTLLIVALLSYLSLKYLLPYVGGSLLLIILIIGFLPPYLAGGKHPMHKLESCGLSFITLGLTALGLLLLTYQSILFFSILFVLPLLLPIVLLLSYIAFRINDKKVFRVKDFFR